MPRGGPRANSGGVRPGQGRPRKGADSFREWCRSVIDHPEVRAAVEARAKRDPEFALKLGEHGYGKAPQSLTIGSDPKAPLLVEHRASFADGTPFGAPSGLDPVLAATATLPAGGSDESGEG
jgi:hypothetical protein